MDVGIKETREALDGAFKLLEVIIEELSDGVELSDAVAIFAKLQSKPAIRSSLEKAAKDIGKVPAELSNLDINEMMALSMIVFTHLPKLLAAFSHGKKN